MAISGSLEDASLADICQLLAMGGKSGCLTVTAPGNTGRVFFEQGRVTHASILDRPDRLGELLVGSGRIDREQLARAIEAQRAEPGTRIGELLVRAGALDRETLMRYVAAQIEEAVYRLLAWERGSFHFVPGERPEPGALLLDLRTENLLLESARRLDEWSVIARKIPSLDLQLCRARAAGEAGGAALSPEERRLLALLEGRRSLAELAQQAGLLEFDAAKAAYGLLQAGLIERACEPSDTPPPADPSQRQRLDLAAGLARAGLLDEAAVEYEALLEDEPEGELARQGLAMVELRRGREQRALALLEGVGPRGYGELRNLALAHELSGDVEGALALVREAEALRPEDPDLALARGVLHLRRGEGEAAVEAFRAARSRPGGDPPSALWYSYAVLALALSGRRAEAETEVAEGLARYPEHGALLVHAGVVLDALGEPETAGELWSRAAATARPPAQALKNLGDQCYRVGEAEEARRHYEEAVRLDPDLGPDVYLRLGLLARAEGDLEGARRLWERGRQLEPEHATLRELLGEGDP